MLPLATIITPNWYEVECGTFPFYTSYQIWPWFRVLTDISIKDIESLREALSILHETYQVPNVVISSIPLRPWLLAALPPSLSSPTSDGESEHLFCLASSTEPSPSAMHVHDIDGQKKIHGSTNTSKRYLYRVHAACIPLLPGYFSGVGDFFSALVLAHFQLISPHPSQFMNSPSPLSELSNSLTPLTYAVSLAVTKTHTILAKTHEHSASLPADERQPSDDELDVMNPMRRVKRMRGRELALIQGQDIIRGIGLTSENIRWMGEWDAFWGPWMSASSW